jgi:hypothetical protein
VRQFCRDFDDEISNYLRMRFFLTTIIKFSNTFMTVPAALD